MFSFQISPVVVALALLMNIQLASEVDAHLVGIQYFDTGSANPDTNGGPQWQGVVDTITNNLRIDTWTELPQHGTEYWVPASLPQVPLIWTARDATGNVYDVPDDFGFNNVGGTVSIDDNFAFISPDSAQEMSWVYDIAGDGIDPAARQIGTVVKPTRIGWGGFARQETINGPFTFYTAAINGEAAYDEKTMPRLPVEDANSIPPGTTNALLASGGATVMVTSWSENFSPVITGVPEPSAFLSVGLIGTACAAGTWMRRKMLAKKA